LLSRNEARQKVLPEQGAIPADGTNILCRFSRFRVRILTLLSLLIFFCSATSVRGQVLNREYKIKSAYIYKFATYITWPNSTFKDKKSPFVIGVLGPDPVGSNLKKIAKMKKIDGRKIVVKNFNTVEELSHCHILFMSKALPSETQAAAIKKLSSKHVLFVGETVELLKQGGVIKFEIHGNRVQVIISQPAYERELLEISAKLLAIAKVLKAADLVVNKVIQIDLAESRKDQEPLAYQLSSDVKVSSK